MKLNEKAIRPNAYNDKLWKRNRACLELLSRDIYQSPYPYPLLFISSVDIVLERDAVLDFLEILGIELGARLEKDSHPLMEYTLSQERVFCVKSNAIGLKKNKKYRLEPIEVNSRLIDFTIKELKNETK